MNDPIISPWLMYVLGIVGDVKCLLGVAGGAGALCGFVFLMCRPAVRMTPEYSWERNDEWAAKKVAEKRSLLIWGRPLVVWGAIMLLLAVVAPSRGTVISMIVADNVTPANLSKAGVVVEDVRDALKADVLEIIEAINDDEPEAKCRVEERDQ